MSILRELLIPEHYLKRGSRFAHCPVYEETTARNILFILRADYSRRLFSSREISRLVGSNVYIVSKYLAEIERVGAISIYSNTRGHRLYKCNFEDEDIERILNTMEKNSMDRFGR